MNKSSTVLREETVLVSVVEINLGQSELNPGDKPYGSNKLT